ncbi:MAG: DUF6624 domain-containing protein [Bacteroidota bacterium]
MNQELAQQILALAAKDQEKRYHLFNLEHDLNSSQASKQQARAEIQATDQENLIAIRAIFEEHGFPSKSLVGEEASHRFWVLVQHADQDVDFQAEVTADLSIKCEAGEADVKDYAFLLDRVRVNRAQKQVYGTQVELKADGSAFIPKPLEDPDTVEQRRAQVGLEPLSKYLIDMNELYSYSLKTSRKTL